MVQCDHNCLGDDDEDVPTSVLANQNTALSPAAYPCLDSYNIKDKPTPAGMEERRRKEMAFSQRIMLQTSRLSSETDMSFAHCTFSLQSFKTLDIQSMHVHLILISIFPCLTYLHIRQITFISYKIRVKCAIKAAFVSELLTVSEMHTQIQCL